MARQNRTRSAGFAQILTAAIACVGPAQAQSAAPQSAPQADTPRIVKLAGVWVEGPGAIVSYGAPFGECASRCLADTACKMIEYYRPEKKCNQYHEMRPRVKGGSSDVGIKQ